MHGEDGIRTEIRCEHERHQRSYANCTMKCCELRAPAQSPHFMPLTGAASRDRDRWECPGQIWGSRSMGLAWARAWPREPPSADSGARSPARLPRDRPMLPDVPSHHRGRAARRPDGNLVRPGRPAGPSGRCRGAPQPRARGDREAAGVPGQAGQARARGGLPAGGGVFIVHGRRQQEMAGADSCHGHSGHKFGHVVIGNCKSHKA